MAARLRYSMRAEKSPYEGMQIDANIWIHSVGFRDGLGQPALLASRNCSECAAKL